MSMSSVRSHEGLSWWSSKGKADGKAFQAAALLKSHLLWPTTAAQAVKGSAGLASRVGANILSWFMCKTAALSPPAF